MFQKKQIFKPNILKQLLSDENSCVSVVPSTRLLALPPFFLNDMKAGIIYLLNCMLKKYDRSLGGIIIGYQNIKVLMDENTGIIPMGTSETEINISVEFYIFQPKVGSFLKGVVNKRSPTHIGCLVHQYFNATILKPEDVDFDEWICKDFNVNDKIVFRVKELDFTSLLPLIEGEVGDNNVLKKESSRNDENLDKSDDNAEENNVLSTNEFLKRVNTIKQSDSKFMKSTNEHSKTEELESLDININTIEKKSDSSAETKLEVKNKTPTISVCAYDGNDAKKGKNSEKREVIKGCDLDIKEYESSNEKKKKKKDRKMKEIKSQDSFSAFNNVEKETESNSSKCSSTLDKYGALEDEDSSVFLSPFKLKKEKKRRKNNELLNRTSECLSPIREDQLEDNVFCSTQLEPGSESKMEILFCSPIPRGTAYHQKEDEKAEKRLDVSALSEVNGEEKKKKRKKRKQEEDEELIGTSKKIRTNASSSQEEDRLESDKLVDLLNKHEISKIMEDLDNSDKDRIKKMKGTQLKLNKKLKTDGVEETQEKSISSKQLNFCNEKNSIYRKVQLSKGTLELKNDKNVQINNDDQTYREKRKPDKLHKEEKKKVYKERSKEKNKLKILEEKSERSQEGSVDFLYNKLLRDAISAINVEDDSSKETAVNKGTELLVSSLCADKKRKKSKVKKKINDSINEQSEESFKNGSMYDVIYSPEKLNPDKSLFTDSEQSHNSPVKKWKLVNGVTASSKVQSQLFSEATASSMNVRKMPKIPKK